MIRRLSGFFCAVVILGELTNICSAQISVFPHVQNFDSTSIQPPALPFGWSSTQNRTPGTNDFTTSTTTPRSSPNVVGSTNATISQSLVSPAFDFFGIAPDSLVFHVRRSATHNARMLVEASLNGDTTFSIHLSDSLTNTLPNSYVQIKLGLPAVLATSHAVKFRWRIIADAGGTTGTLRIDDISVSALRAADLALSGVRFQPQFPVEGDTIFTIAKIKNVGQQSAQIFSAEFYVDGNNDSIPQPSELKATAFSTAPIAVNDSAELSGNVGNNIFGLQLLIAKVMYAADQNLSNNQALASFAVGYRSRSIVVNEIMYAPAAPEPEWIELNNTRTDSVNLKGWLISDNNLASKHVITTQNIYVPANQFVLLTGDSAGLRESRPGIRARIVNVSRFPSLNNTGDAVVLYDNRSATIDSLGYLPTWGGNTNGNSLERIDPLGLPAQQSNWGTSRNPARSTPGERNSLARKDRDLAVDSLRLSPSFPFAGDSVQVVVPVRNLGREQVPSFVVSLYRDANADSLPQSNELIAVVVSSSPLLPLDSTTIAFGLGTVAETQLIIAKAVFAADEDTTNNIRFGWIAVGYSSGTIRVNEIMYAPTGTEPEWVELYNTHPDSINLKNWLVSDNIVSTKRVITTQDIIVPPNGFAVLAKDSAALFDIHPNIRSKVVNVPNLPSLNNSGDAVVLYDNRSATMDSVAYVPSWGGSASGNSLERIDPLGVSTQQSNWGSSRSPSRSTPGERNSISRKDHDLLIDSVRVSPSLPVLGDSVHFVIPIRNIGREAAAGFTVQLFRDANADSLTQPNELITSTVLSLRLLPLDSTVVSLFAGNAQAGTHLFVSKITFAGDEDTTNNIRYSRIGIGYPVGAVRINEIMYAPNPGVSEWVELFNTRTDTIDLNKWTIGNRSLGSRYDITSSRLPVPPNDFVVITKDTALLHVAYPSLTGRIVQTSSLPTFLWNNGGDAVVLSDNRKVIMDSLFYRTTWGGSNGRSVERIDPLAAADDSMNWATSLDSIGATPAHKNSQVILDDDLRLVRVTSDTIASGANARLNIVVLNVGRNQSGQFELRVFDDDDGDSVGAAGEQILQLTVPQTLAQRESTVVPVIWTLPPSGIRRVIALVSAAADQRQSNNAAFSIVRVGFPEHTLIVNEIMYAPLTDNAEYIELYNASQTDIDVAQWKIHDRVTSGTVNEFRLSTISKIVHAGEMFVLASDSSLARAFPGTIDRACTIVNQSSLSLNNDGDDIVLVDPAGLVIDSVRYSPLWHNSNITDRTGRSLEKINPQLNSAYARNWTTCTLPIGGTPGNKNSVFAVTPSSGAKLTVAPNPFSPDGDGREDFAIIQYEMPLAVSMIRLRIYDAIGRRIRTLTNNEPSGSHGSVVWDGMDDEKQKARIGIYIMLLEAIDANGGVLETAKGVVVLAAKL